MGKHRLEDKRALEQEHAVTGHRLDDRRSSKQQRGGTGFFRLGRRDPDNLYERSFRFCTRCGEEVYVLADGCRNCGDARNLTPAPAL